MSIKLMSQVWDLDLPGEQQQVMLALADHAHDDGSHCYPSVAYLAWKTGKGERTITRLLSALRADGLLIAVAGLQGGRARPTLYQLRLAAGHPKPPFVKGANSAAFTNGGEPPSPVTINPAKTPTPVAANPDTGVGGTVIEPYNHKEPFPEGRPEARASKNLGPLIKIFEERSLQKPALDGRNARAAVTLMQTYGAQAVADCWWEIVSAQYGDEFLRMHLSFVYLQSQNLVANWQSWVARGRPPLTSSVQRATSATTPKALNVADWQTQARAGMEDVERYWAEREAREAREKNGATP